MALCSSGGNGYKTVEEFIDFQSGDFMIEDNRYVYLCKRDFLTLPNLWMLCMDDDFMVQYFGGLWVIFEFTS